MNERVFISSECHAKYRRRSKSLVETVRQDGRYDDVRSFYLDWCERYLQANNVRDREIWSLLKEALLPYRHPAYFRWVHVKPKAVRKKARSLRRKIVKSAKRALNRLP
jgi:hypothetical protein